MITAAATSQTIQLPLLPGPVWPELKVPAEVVAGGGAACGGAGLGDCGLGLAVAGLPLGGGRPPGGWIVFGGG